ncbi:ABC transporter ATP-binding protein [Bdellovibrio svalbardensis]|uniref:ABC transporter transmembrane domain-containing protein n=1 Tax=Bdellovibrio svalbardensis TaxID=2972972 RepID=A0ABT6DGU7_9BACT|nr:ABC transporter transmembrane domain-containing protein [Bdellovibrio svalbardensis]MDG0816051.1 ABC transporter transmembrane domain-containing protein [Bdellovibrio svalbardensis]
MSKQNRTVVRPKYLSDGEVKREGGYNKTIYQTLHMAYKPFLGRIGLCIGLGVLGRGLLLANTNVIGYWVDTLVGKPSPLTGMDSKQIIILLMSMVLTGFAMTLVFRVGFSRLSAKAISSFYDEVTLRTSRLPMSFFDNTPAGRIITRFSSDYGNIFRLFGGPLAEFLAIIFDLVMMVILITIANPLFLIFVLFIAALNYLIYKLNQAKLRQARRELSASRSPSIAHFAETTQGASTIRSFRRQASFTERFESLDRYYLSQRLYTTRQILSFSFQMNSLSAFLLLITGVSSYFMVEKGWASIGSVGVAFTFIALSGNTVQMFFEWLTQFEEAMIGVERLDQYMRMELEQGSLLPASSQFSTGHATYTPTLEKYLNHRRLTEERCASVEIKDLWFRYREDLPWVLKNLNLEIKAGERLGIVGRTGSGKSSLIQALFYLYPIDKGHIAINGHQPKLQESAQGVDLNLYRQSIAFISQEPILFQGTLRSNLDIDNSLTEEKLTAVLRQVGLLDWVLTQPQGLDMRIEERGKNLSLGERQLLCMARCLLQQSPIVIMDEATSSVDPQSEEILVRATEEFFSDRTQIIIAHRLSTLAKCDRILWLQSGEVVALGPTAEILPRFKKTELV